MDEEYRNILKNVTDKLVKDMEVEEVLLKMADSRVFSENDVSAIKAEKTRQKQCIKFLDILPRQGPKAYNNFKKALQNAHQVFLAEILEEAEDEELKSEFKRVRAKSARLSARISQTSTKERETTNSPESEVDELQNVSKDLPKDHEGLDTYPDNNEQIQRSNDLPQDEKRCRQCYHRKMENDASMEKVKALHDILSQFEDKHVEEKELFEKAKKCAKEFLERHDKEDNKEAIGLNGQMGEISLDKPRAEEIPSKQNNDNESLETENKRQIIKLEQEKKKLEEENNHLASKVDAKESEIREIKGNQEKKKAERHNVDNEHFSCCEKVAQLRRQNVISKSKTASYISLPWGDKHGLGYTTDVLAHISGKTGHSIGVIEYSSCVMIDLGENYCLFPTQFTLQEKMCFSTLEGCTGDSRWETLKIVSTPLVHFEHRNMRTWLVEGNVSAFRYFRIFQTDRLHGTHWPYHPSYGLQLYGVLIELQGIK